MVAEPYARLGSTVRSAAQMRTLTTAQALFAEYGVGATSYQMIADAIGVTKGAIYHQFNTKDEIILAATEMNLARLEEAMEAAEADDNPQRGRERLLKDIVDLGVEHRRATSTIVFDPVILRLLNDHEPFQQFIRRLYALLVGGGDDRPAFRVRLAGLASVIGGALVHPLVADIDDDTLRTEILEMVRQLVGLPQPTSTTSG